LVIRKFVQGQDEAIVVDVWNQAHRGEDDFWPDNAEDFRKREASPWFDAEGRFIAEWDGQPVGTVAGHVDRNRTDRRGYLFGPSVVPESRRKGIGRKLIATALESLKSRGMETVLVDVRSDAIPGRTFAESLGFRMVRLSCTMRRDLVQMPEHVGENQELKVREVRADKEDEIRRFHDLFNETFSEEFDFRQDTLDDTLFYLSNPVRDSYHHYYYIGWLSERPVGLITVSKDETQRESPEKEECFMSGLGVLKSARGHGVGKALMLHGLRHLKDLGANWVELTVDTLNPTHAMRLYERLGFKVRRQTLVYEKKL